MMRRVWVVVLAILIIGIGGSINQLRLIEQLPTWADVRTLPNAEQDLVEFLLLLPLAALICAFVRNVVGVMTFGTFAPALLGLAFRECDSPIGLFILLIVLTIGWMLRRGIAGLHLLQIPRSSVMLSLVAIMLVVFVLWSNAQGRPLASALPFLPLVIVTGLVERFWTMEEESGTEQAIKTMATTLLTAAGIYLLTRWPTLRAATRQYPEGIFFVLSLQLMLGRYTGFRLTELYRFRHLSE